MAWSKTFAASSILPSSTASDIGNITVSISSNTSFAFDENCSDDGLDNFLANNISVSVTRSVGADPGWGTSYRIDFYLTPSATFDESSTILYIGASFFGTSKNASVEISEWSSAQYYKFFAHSGTNKTAYLYMHVENLKTDPWSCVNLGSCITVTYARKPRFESTSYIGDNGDVPQIWGASYLYQGLSKPNFEVLMKDVPPDGNTYGEGEGQPWGLRLSSASGSFCGASATDPSASGTVIPDNGLYNPTYELQFGYITNATGTGTVTANSTRQTSNQLQISRSVRAYSPPEIASLDTYRCDSSGNASDDGTYVKVELQGRIWASQDTQQSASVTVELFEGTNPDTANDTPVATKSLTLQFATSTWQQATASGTCILGASGGIIHTQGITEDDTPGPAEVDKAYTVLVTIADDARSGSMSDVVPQAFYTMDFLAGGHGVAIGKPATVAGLFDVGMDLNVDGTATIGNDTTAMIKAKTPSRNGSVLIVGGGVKAEGDVNGTALRLGAGGLTLIGGGEYASHRYEVADQNDTNENLFLGSDVDVYIESNGNTIANRKTWRFGNDGILRTPHSIRIISPSIDRDGSNPSSEQTTGIGFYDKDSENIGFIDMRRTTDGRMDLRMYAYNEKSDGTQVGTGIQARVWKDGARRIYVDSGTHVQLWGSNITDGSTSTSVESDGRLVFCDKNGVVMCRMHPHNVSSDSTQRFRILVQRVVSGTTKYNGLNLGINSAGEATIVVEGTNAAASWRAAIGANSATNLTTGTLPNARVAYASKDYTSAKTYGAIQFRKWGRMCTCDVNSFKSLASGSNTLISSLDAAYRPVVDVSMTRTDPGDGKHYRFSISAAGVVTVYAYSSPPSTINIDDTFTYVTAS